MKSLPLFINHYETPLQINNIFFDVYFLLILLFLVIITLRKSSPQPPLSFLQTNQMRGLGIILIILNHICYYTDPSPFLYKIWAESGMIGVAIFLIFSGYGLCYSLEKKGTNNFFKKRIAKIFIPLILALSLLQFFYLTLTPNTENIFWISAKILFAMYSLDAKTWFIIFILFWYCLLYLSYKFKLSNKQKLLFLIVISWVIISFPQANPSAKANAFSFPFGCWLGLNSPWIQSKIEGLFDKKILIIVSGFLAIILGCGLIIWEAEILQYNAAYLIILIASIVSAACAAYLYFVKQIRFPISSELICLSFVIAVIYLNYTNQVFQENILGQFNIFWGLTRSLANIFLASTLILLFSLTSKFKVYSLFLSFLGNISFELFLIHNTFLVHFDFFLFRLPIVIGFILYFSMVCLFSIVLKQLSGMLTKLITS